MSELTRRRFVRSSAGAAAGMTAIGALAASRADARETSTEPIVAYVRNPSTGEVAVFHGEHETVIHDRALAARLVRATR